jgi:hypothetical protein
MQNTKIENLSCWYDGVFYSEEFRDIPDFGGFYQISNFGRVKSVSRLVGKKIKPDRLLNLRINVHGYLLVTINHAKKTYVYLVHRLVASVFIENPENKKTVNHKFGNKTDNRAWLIEWNTHKENVHHSFKTGLKVNVSGAKASRSIPISQFTKNGIWIKYWWGAREFEIKTGLSRCLISMHLKGKCQTAHGFIWKYKNVKG